jgi:hypothetical protein
MVNPRNLEKMALINPSEKPLKWVSKFGSITFNQIGRELPFGGINESGLVVEHMILDNTVYPSKDSRYPIGAFQWIQFQLDNYSTIEEVINSDTLLRIDDVNNKIHFLVCDRYGRTAVIEFLNGKMVCHTLNMVSQGLFTKWSIVYDITNMRIYFKIFETPTIVGEMKIFLKQPPYDPITKVIDFKGLDFSCSGGAKVLDLDCNHEKVVNQYFVNYSNDINKEFIVKAFTFYKGWGLKIDLKDEELDYLAKYPDKFRCIENN